MFVLSFRKNKLNLFCEYLSKDLFVLSKLFEWAAKAQFVPLLDSPSSKAEYGYYMVTGPQGQPPTWITSHKLVPAVSSSVAFPELLPSRVVILGSNLWSSETVPFPAPSFPVTALQGCRL